VKPPVGEIEELLAEFTEPRNNFIHRANTPPIAMPKAQTDEKIKHRNALELEKQKWAYKKEELQYVEAGQHLRSLNQLMWQVPSLAIALTGGLWYGATLVGDETTRRLLLGFSAGVDLLTIITLLRLRSVIGVHINFQKQFAGATSQDQDRFRY
jgi:hypothetical protein